MDHQDEQQDWTPDIRQAVDALLMENMTLDDIEAQLLQLDHLDPDDVVTVITEYRNKVH